LKVAVDAQLAVGTATGIGEYVRGLIDALRALDVDVEALADEKLDPWRFDRRVFWDQVVFPQRVRQLAPDVVHCASGTVPLGLAIPYVVTVHDVAWLRVQAHARPYARYYFGRFSIDRYRRAAAIAVDSAFSREELLASDYCALERRGGDRRTSLAIGTVERRKNLEALIEALPFLERARLVSVGPYTTYQDECLGLAQALGVENRVEFRGYVPRAELLGLCSTAAVIAVPSLYEGFGYAAAQAMCAGVPAIVSDQASLPEIVGDGARIVPATDEQQWIEALRTALRGDDDARAHAGRAAAIERFAWENSAREMLAAYEMALGKG
jgi:glycosyltransferase involved in cell wall biosynthesis